ncbi:hypothetical protein JCM8547_005119 [Rhodosporidiobolus lusitaniae]
MGLLQKLEVPAKEGASRALDNEDLRPTPLERRTWGFGTYTLFWWTAVGNTTNFSSGSAWLTAGFNVLEALGCSTAGYFIISWIMVLNGRPGAKWHIGFPVAARSSFGIWGAGWPALNRAFMACLWQGINAVSGAQALYLMFYALSPRLVNIHNGMDSRSALNSMEMVMFFLFQGLVGFMCMLQVPKWPLLVYAKVIVFVLSSVGLLAWTLTAAGGADRSLFTQGGTLSGSEKSWQLLRLILTSAASCSTFASNAADFQRQATKPTDPILGQLIGFPLSNMLTQVIGMTAAATSPRIYGELIWNPVTLLTMLLADNYDAKHRAAAFFISLGFVYNLMFSCVFENVLPAGNDISSLLPRFISIKRGFLICLLVSTLICPWYLLGSASILITVVSSYQIFLFSIIGIMLVDYYVISKGFFDIDQLFTPSKNGKYYYTYGVNLRAIAAYLVGVAVNFCGFLTNFDIIVSTKLTRSYWFSIFTTTFSAAFVYWVSNKIWPQPNLQESWSEPKGNWEPTEEQMGHSSTAAIGGLETPSLEKEASFEKEDEARAEVRDAQVHELRA